MAVNCADYGARTGSFQLRVRADHQQDTAEAILLTPVTESFVRLLYSTVQFAQYKLMWLATVHCIAGGYCVSLAVSLYVCACACACACVLV